MHTLHLFPHCIYVWYKSTCKQIHIAERHLLQNLWMHVECTSKQPYHGIFGIPSDQIKLKIMSQAFLNSIVTIGIGTLYKYTYKWLCIQHINLCWMVNMNMNINGIYLPFFNLPTHPLWCSEGWQCTQAHIQIPT